MKKGTKYSQLSYEERIKIATLKEHGESVRSIARILKRSPGVISRELEEKKIKGVYVPKKAQHKTYWRRYRSKRNCLKVAMSKELSDLVHKKLQLGWSPERIAGYAKRNGRLVSKKAVYKYIKSRCLERYLFWKKNKRKGGRKRGRLSPGDLEKRLVENRPKTDSSGHWELDFIVSRQSPAVLLVMVDRFSRKTIVCRLEQKTHQKVLKALMEIKNYYGLKTITTDNDIVFKNWKDMEATIKTIFFFCHPYHSWEKGLVENTNRWIRCFVPKKRDLAMVTGDEFRSIELFLNETPRQCLGYRTANEVLLENIIN